MNEFVGAFWGTLTQMSPYLLLGFLVAGLLSVFLSPRLIERHLGGGGLWPLVKASLFGVPLPLCSCGVIPVTMSLRKHGAGKGAAIAFLLSTPQTGVDSIFVTYSLLGPVFAIIRPVAALITGLVGGALVSVVDGRAARGDVKCEDECCSTAEGRPPAMARMMKHAFVTLPRDIGLSMLVGLVIAAVISAVVPDDYFASVLGGGILAMIVMVLAGVPVYVCATASVPVAAALIAKGVSPGVALVFLMTGPATNAASLTTIWANLGARTAITYLATVGGAALGSGVLVDALLPNLGAVIQEHVHHAGDGFWGNAAAVVLLWVLAWGAWSKYGARKAADKA